jgi:hypothetical protein
MNLNEIIEHLQEAEVSPSDFYYEEVDYIKDEAKGEAKEAFDKIGKIDILEQGLNEDSYDAYVIVHFVDHNIYMKLTAQYDSYQSEQNFEEWGEEVHPREITKVVYD